MDILDLFPNVYIGQDYVFSNEDKLPEFVNEEIPSPTFVIEEENLSSRIVHKCEFCAYVTHRKHHLIVHLRVHTQERPYACDQCKKTFKTQGHCATHRRTHFEHFPFLCVRCEFKSKHQACLRRHEHRIHGV